MTISASISLIPFRLPMMPSFKAESALLISAVDVVPTTFSPFVMTISPLIFIVVVSIVGSEYHYMAHIVRFTFIYYPYIAAFAIGLAYSIAEKYDCCRLAVPLPWGKSVTP